MTKIKYIVHNVHDYSVLYKTLFVRFYVRVCVILRCGKHLHDGIISLRGEVWVNKISLTAPLLMKCLYQARKVNGHVFSLSVSIVPLSTLFSIRF